MIEKKLDQAAGYDDHVNPHFNHSRYEQSLGAILHQQQIKGFIKTLKGKRRFGSIRLLWKPGTGTMDVTQGIKRAGGTDEDRWLPFLDLFQERLQCPDEVDI